MWIQVLRTLSCGCKSCTHCHVDTRPAHTVMWIQDPHTLSCGYKTRTHCHVDTSAVLPWSLWVTDMETWRTNFFLEVVPKSGGWSLIRVLLMGGCGRHFCVSNTGQTTKLPSVANTKISATPTLNYWSLLLFLWQNSYACIRYCTVTLCKFCCLDLAREWKWRRELQCSSWPRDAALSCRASLPCGAQNTSAGGKPTGGAETKSVVVTAVLLVSPCLHNSAESDERWQPLSL